MGQPVKDKYMRNYTKLYLLLIYLLQKPSGSRTTSISQGSGVDADDLVSHVDNVTDAKEQDESSNVNKVVRGEEDSDSEADGHSTNAGAIEPSDSRSSGQPSVDSSCRDSQEFMAVASSVVGVGGIDNGTHEEGEGEDKGNHEEGEGEDTGSHEEGEGEDKGSQEGEGEDKGSHEEGEGEDKGSHEEGEGEDKENHEKIEENQRVIKQGLQEGTSIPADCMIDDDSEEDTDDDEDEDGWITPSNIREVCRAMGDLNMDKATVAVGCLTTDFAMQVCTSEVSETYLKTRKQPNPRIICNLMGIPNQIDPFPRRFRS